MKELDRKSDKISVLYNNNNNIIIIIINNKLIVCY
jgi:hypothetical protein